MHGGIPIMNYAAIKQKLIEKRQHLEQRLRQTQQHIKHMDGPPNPDFAEQATERQNEDVVYGLDEAARVELEQIKQALYRIEHNEYGYCQECGAQIPYERLEAVPYTAFCRDCMEERFNRPGR
jgi:RNA polymerase-binding protein DksA